MSTATEKRRLKIQKLNALWRPELNPGTEKGHEGTNKSNSTKLCSLISSPN